MTELLTIGAFARAVDLAPSALRFYHEAGLLAPTEVDPQTGYRYYTREQERRALLLSRLRTIGVPVETMRSLLDGTPDEARVLLTEAAREARENATRTSEVVTEILADLGTQHDRAEITVDGPELAAALGAAWRSASREPGSGLAVVLLDIDADGLTVVATDRHRLTAWTLPGAGSGEHRVALAQVEPLIRTLSRLSAVRLVLAGDVTVDEQVLPVEPDRFPAYRALLRALAPVISRVTIDRSALLGALIHDVVRLQALPDRLTVAGLDAEGVRLPAVLAGPPFTVGFAAPLLIDVIDGISGPTVSLAFAGPAQPSRVRAPDQREPLLLVMPTDLDP